MAYWIVNDIRTAVLVIPLCWTGEEQVWNAQLVIESGDSFDGLYLCLKEAQFAGCLEASVNDGEYRDVSIPGDASCAIGDVIGPAEVRVSFSLTLPDSLQTGQFVVHVLALAQGLSTGRFRSDVEVWPDTLLAPHWCVGDAPDDEGDCTAVTYDRLIPLEALSKGDPVYVDTSGAEPGLRVATNNASFEEAAAIGVIDDTATNFAGRAGCAVASDGGTYVYRHGGGASGSATLDRLNVAFLEWFDLPGGGGTRREHISWWYNGNYYVHGGLDGSGTYLNTISRFDSVLLTWTTLTAGGTARALHAVILVGDKAHLVGGVNGSGIVLATDVFDMTAGTWAAGTAAPAGMASLDVSVSPIHRPAWQACDNTLYYGGTRATYTRQFYSYLPATGTWGVPSRLPDTIIPDRFTVPNVPLSPTVGEPQSCTRVRPWGTDGPAVWPCVPLDGSASSCWMVEDLGLWWDLIRLDLRRVLVSGVVGDDSWTLTPGDQAYLGDHALTYTRPTVGHVTLFGEVISETQVCINPSSEAVYSWVVWEGSAIRYDGTRFLYEYGGDDGNGVHNHLRRLDTWTGTWTDLPDGCTARRDAAMVSINGYLYVGFGQDADGNALSTLCIYSTWTSTWQGPYETPCDARISPVMLPWYNSTTGRWEIHVLGGFTEAGVVMTTCIYTPNDGDDQTPDEENPPDDPTEDDWDEGEPPPDGFDDDMDWHPPASANSDDATEQVNCFPGYDATYKTYEAGYQIGNKLYAIDKDNEEIIKFDADTGTWHNYDSILSWPEHGITFIEVYDGKIWALSVWNPDEMEGALAMYSWEPGDESWYHYEDLGEAWENNGREAYAMVLSGGGFYIYYTGNEGEGYITFTPGVMGGSWGDDYVGDAFGVAPNLISDGTRGWTIGYNDGLSEFISKRITVPATIESIQGMPETFSSCFLGATSTKLFVAFGTIYDEIEGYTADTSVRYFDTVGSQWFEYVGTIFKYSESPASALAPRVAAIGDYLYWFATECDEFGENCQLCVWRFDTTFEAGTGQAAWPVSMSYLTSSGVAGIVFFLKRDPDTGAVTVYSYNAVPDPVTGKHYTQLLGASPGDDWGEVRIKYQIWKALHDAGLVGYEGIDLYFPPMDSKFSVDESQGPIDPNNPNSTQVLRYDQRGRIFFVTVPGF